MKLLYVSSFKFVKEGKEVYGLPSCVDAFFQKYLDVFDSVLVLGEQADSYLDKRSFVKIQDKRISVEIIPANTRPRDFVNDWKVKRELEKYISQAEAILIKPASRKGMKAIELAKKYRKPYMIEMTGDIHNALRQHPSRLKRMYAPILYRQIRNHIQDCPFGLYVSESYLQHEFPIDGRMCGCSDVVITDFSEEILERRIAKIEKMKDQSVINLGLIGFYQGKMKGVDTAIRALGRLPEKYHLHILGNGTQENRDKWIAYGQQFGINNRIHFPAPLPGSDAVMEWLDDIDFFVFPTRSEGFGRCVAEAMARGCVCFATDICTMPELLEPDCLFPMGDDEAIAKKIIGYSEDQIMMKNNARRNFNKAKSYDFCYLKDKRNDFLRDFRTYCQEKDSYGITVCR